MRLHPQGLIPLTVVFLALLGLAVFLNLAFPEQTYVHYFLYWLGIAFLIICIRFFRVPSRVISATPGQVVSAADGHVVVIEKISDPDYYHDERIQVSVFMSPLNVHVNWYPISGEILYTKYHRGSHIPAYRPKASRENERRAVVVGNEHGQSVMMVQIAGLVARRVFTNARQGAYVFQGEQAGIIKFGSRVDLILPKDAEILVHLGQTVRACETVIARIGE
jgi:phosphatidylserine decarboxylase